MATLKLTNLGDGSVRWTISGLSKDFTTGNGYVSAGITSSKFTQQADQIYDIVSETSAGSSGTTSVSGEEYLGAGRYQFWGFTETKDAGYWPAGSASVTITERPVYTDFEWTYSGINPSSGKAELGAYKKSGYGVHITANEWNELIDNANERLGESMGHVRQGATITASAVNVLARVLGVETVSRDEPMSAAFFNGLMDAVNRAG